MSRNPDLQLLHFLSDMYSVEQQALAQLISVPALAGDVKIAEVLSNHITQTEQQAALLRERLEAWGGSPSAIKEAVMKLAGKGFLLFARMIPETPAHLAAHCYSYEAMEWAGYEMLKRFAEAAGDWQTVEVATIIGAQERAMMQRLESRFHAVEKVSHAATPAAELTTHVCRHLAETHALEMHGIQLLDRSTDIVGDPELTRVCKHHASESRRHAQALEQRLDVLSTRRSSLENTAMDVGGLNWSSFFQAQADTPAKLAAFIYAFEHLKIAIYQFLRRTAKRAADSDTANLCALHLADETAMVDRSAGTFDSAVEATLAAV